MRVLVFGGGYTGRRFAATLRRAGVEVSLTSRTPPEGEAGWLRFDPEAGALPTARELVGFSHVLVTIPPDSGGQDPVLGRLGSLLGRLPLQWLGYLSTTGVYGDSGGAWVDEGSRTNAGLGRSQARLRSEQAWRDTGLPLQILRLPAIYGPGRTPFSALRDGSARLIHKPGQVFSRIHVDDIAAVLAASIARPNAGRVYNVCDDEPSPPEAVVAYAARLLGQAPPPLENYDEVRDTLSPMAASFYDESKRVRNSRMKDELGVKLLYPTYREGLRALLAASIG